MPKVTTRKERIKEQRECYVKWIGRCPHSHTPSLETSLVESYSSPYLSSESRSDGSMDESHTESSLNTNDQSLSGASFDSEEGRPTSGRKSRQENPNRFVRSVHQYYSDILTFSRV